MLSLTRKRGERVRCRCQCGCETWVQVRTVTTAQGVAPKVRLAFYAPPDMDIWREELLPESERFSEPTGVDES